MIIALFRSIIAKLAWKSIKSLFKNRIMSFFIKNKRAMMKALTWRLIGTGYMIIVSWLITGEIFVGLAIGVFDLLGKIALFFIHEKIWEKRADKEVD